MKEGGKEAAVNALRSVDTALADRALFNDEERAVVELAVDMTRKVEVSDASFAKARTAIGGDQAIVELVGVIATYNMVSRFLVALGIEAEKPGT